MSEAFDPRMKFKVFTWQDNPETLSMRVIREPEYAPDEAGRPVYSGLGPLCRVVTGSGVFHGPAAYEYFNTLQVLLATGTPGELIHPIWGTMSAALTELTMENEGREDFVAYSFTFREADASGCIPALPERER